MPRRDGTGPAGRGPMTGRGLGLCAAGLAAPALLGLAFGRGRGRGWRNTFHATGLTGRQRAAMGMQAFGGRPSASVTSMTKDQEVELLKQQADVLASQLGNIKQRIDELSSQGTAKE